MKEHRAAFCKSAPTREQLIDAVAALKAAGDTLCVLHEPDSGAGEFFGQIAERLQEELLGYELVGDDTWMEDPLEVEIYSRAAELEAAALEQTAPLAERITTLRLMAPRYRTFGTINIRFDDLMRCASCGIGTRDSGEGCQAKLDEGHGLAEFLCPACANGGGDAS